MTLGKSGHLSKPLLMAGKPHKNYIVIEKPPRADVLFPNSANVQHSLAKAQRGRFFKLHQEKARPLLRAVCMEAALCLSRWDFESHLWARGKASGV